LAQLRVARGSTSASAFRRRRLYPEHPGADQRQRTGPRARARYLRIELV